MHFVGLICNNYEINNKSILLMGVTPVTSCNLECSRQTLLNILFTCSDFEGE